MFLLDKDRSYKLFSLNNREFTFDVDVFALPCGINGAIEFVAMDADRGMGRYPGNKAGAKYGTGYCSAQCPDSVIFINGEANCEDWNSDKQTGRYGSYCPEIDIWESNLNATAFTPHVCKVEGQTRCEGIDCGDDASNQRYSGICDKDGCDFNPYRLGNRTFYGPTGNVIDSTWPFTVITQFITSNGTDSGDLVLIKHIWKQDGKVYQNSVVSIDSRQYYSITDEFVMHRKKSLVTQTITKM